jgi:YfiH family protein
MTVRSDTPAAPALRWEPWAARRDLVHGFFGRAGGVSEGAWSSLNLSAAVGDDPAAVEENWTRMRAALGAVAIVRMRQVHGDRVVRVRVAGQDVGEADGLVTDTPALALAVFTADCVPILMIAPERRVAMALHAGWRGTAAGVVRRGVEVAERELGVGADEWEAALGPSIGGCCYEVGPEVAAALASRWGEMPSAWTEAGGRRRLDLRKANRVILTKVGVPNARIVDVGPCTACARRDYFSHRAEAGRTGRQLSAVGWLAS